MDAPTPRPWIIRSMEDHCDAEGEASDYEIVGSNGESVTDNQTYYPTAPSEADAAHIVRCVNVHDSLVTALNGALVALKLGEHVDVKAAIDYGMEVLAKEKA